jgi:beta-ketodecanoyl-[acyl-carrier-protein] synthase
LGITGYGFDMNVACSSATFGIQQARDAVTTGSARCVLMVNPEICSGHLNFRDRDSHFIFGDVCTAVIVESAATASSNDQYQILDSRLQTIYSNNIRNNFGFLNRGDDSGVGQDDKLFVQEGRKVFKEVCPAVATQISEQLLALEIAPGQLKRLWLHQANLSMNQLISKRVLGREATADEAPTILDEYANTSSAGSVIAFHKHRADLSSGDLGVLCSFGAGYSIGSVVLRKR